MDLLLKADPLDPPDDDAAPAAAAAAPDAPEAASTLSVGGVVAADGEADVTAVTLAVEAFSFPSEVDFDFRFKAAV